MTKYKAHLFPTERLLEAGIKHVTATTSNGAAVTLHNSGKCRPTKYVLEMDYLTGTLILDTIILKNKKHRGIKKTYSSFGLKEALKDLTELSEQPHEGTLENTNKYFRNMGLLYWDRSMDD
jgi:hypothetical protein